MIKLAWCDDCRHITGGKGFIPTCEAFPEGIPYGFENGRDKELKTCNNGIGYEPKEVKTIEANRRASNG